MPGSFGWRQLADEARVADYHGCRREYRDPRRPARKVRQVVGGCAYLLEGVNRWLDIALLRVDEAGAQSP